MSDALEYLAAINRTPAVKLLGISPSGFNATGESDIRNYYDHIASQQEKVFRAGLQKCLDVLQLNLNGKIDKSLTFKFAKLSEDDKNGLVQYQKTKADVIGGLLDHQIISGEEARKALNDDPDSSSGLDPHEVPEGEGDMPPGGEGGMPGMGDEGESEQQESFAPNAAPIQNNKPQTMDKSGLHGKIKLTSDSSDDDVKAWITTETGVHIPVKEGQTKGEAVKNFVTEKASAKSPSLPTVKNRSGAAISYTRAAHGKEYVQRLEAAKQQQLDTKRWRVDVHDADDYDKNADIYTTKSGGVVAVVNKTDADHTKGDIVSVCSVPGGSERGSDLLKIAVGNGGDRLDSFEGNHGFYIP